jgi:hypothetical protein
VMGLFSYSYFVPLICSGVSSSMQMLGYALGVIDGRALGEGLTLGCTLGVSVRGGANCDGEGVLETV